MELHLEDAAAAQAAPPAHDDRVPAAHTSIKLPEFWIRSPDTWFYTVEANFALKNITREADKFHYTIAALPEDTARKVQHVISAGSNAGCFDRLKEALVASHQMTPYQKAEKLDTLPPLGNRAPSDLLVEMLQYCPPDEQATHLFAYAFLRRMPREVRILLSEDDPADMHTMAKKADRLCSFHVAQSHDTGVYSMESLEDNNNINAVHNNNRSNKKKFVPKGTKQQLQLTSTLCFYHGKYGKKARKCEEPCTWSEN